MLYREAIDVRIAVLHFLTRMNNGGGTAYAEEGSPKVYEASILHHVLSYLRALVRNARWNLNYSLDATKLEPNSRRVQQRQLIQPY